MTSADPTPDRDPSTTPEHPAGADEAVAAGEALSGRGASGGSLDPNDDRVEEAVDAPADRVVADDRDRAPSRSTDSDDAPLDADTVVDDAVEFFTASGDDDSPASDSDAPAPG